MAAITSTDLTESEERSAGQKAAAFFSEVFNRTIAFIVFFGLWEIAPRLNWIDPVFFPPFSKVMVTFWDLLISGALPMNLLVSLQRAATGFALGAVFAIPLGLLIGWFRGFEKLMKPLLETLRQTSAIALYPVLVVIFGLGETSKIALVFWGTIWAMLLNSISGVKNADPVLIKAARAMGASQLVIFTKVILPGAMPYLLTGIRLSATASILILVAAEMMGASKGLGYMLYDAQMKYKIPQMYVAIVTMGILGVSVNTLLTLLERKLLGWKEEINPNA
ncbi:MAG: ABC transporter permease [Spirochaetaceae bacterium]|jgi:NitT/TauT family transport system permease protein|nr:ABC transporter permease [Spirochaetaceae bacterium]